MKARAPRNKTITLTDTERENLLTKIIRTLPTTKLEEPPIGIINSDYCQWVSFLPDAFIDMLFLDPPYNLNKSFNGNKFNKRSVDEYSHWLDQVICSLKRLLKSTATIYICGDWLTSHSIFEVASEHFIIRNRITWEREKGRGAKTNWKNSSEDIWFCTLSDRYTFNVEKVKLRRKVIAPYTHNNGNPKDWTKTERGNYRDTHPSNIWTDITIPFWSMPENTDHPTQKSEKLLAKLILASTNEQDFVFDPFLGSGTTAVVAKKLGRRYLGIELDTEYSLLAAKRIEMAMNSKEIQGFADGVFWERNTLYEQLANSNKDGDKYPPILKLL